MNADLEETLKELGEGYRPVVDRLLAARTAESDGAACRPTFRLRLVRWTAAGLLAASVAGICLMTRTSVVDEPPVAASEPRAVPAAAPSPATPYTLALAPTPAAIDEIVRTQAADGSWANDFLTRQNAAALREVDATSVAYRKAVRYLRTKGLAPLTDDELHVLAARAKSA